MPRWVKILAIVALVGVAALVALGLPSGGEHGPGRHAQPGGDGSTAPASWAAGPLAALDARV
ncbi:MAG: hypothetical protein M3P48_04740 [Actinomycetota bacterium]|nr:hypothetical protein [Actinomycetota bacterium]